MYLHVCYLHISSLKYKIICLHIIIYAIIIIIITEEDKCEE